VGTLTYHHAIFSERCKSSSLNCPYNIEQSALLNKITPSVHVPSRPMYEMTTPVYTSSPPTHKTTSEFYKPTSQVYGPSSTAVEPISQAYEPSPPPYQPTSETREIPSPKYETTSHIHKTSTATYVPTSHTYKPSTSTYKPTPHTYRPSPPYRQTTQFEGVMVSPKYTDSSNKIQCGTQLIQNTPLIAHGEETFPGQWPWHAALYLYMRRDIKFRCGGSYVGTRSVITAAHCVSLKGELLRAEDFMVYLGRYNLRNMNEEGLQYHDVRNIIVHPSYNGTYSIGDIAVLILTTEVEVTALVRPVCLWGQDDGSPADIIDQVGLVVGWGLDERDEPTETLMMVQMPVVNQQTCIWSDPTYYSLFTSNGTFCAGFRNGSSVCNGDSGGGMVFPRKRSDGTEIWTLQGIVSHGRRRDSYSNFCDPKAYIVFTDVGKYLDWLYDIVI
jgi:dynein heavy chain